VRRIGANRNDVLRPRNIRGDHRRNFHISEACSGDISRSHRSRENADIVTSSLGTVFEWYDFLLYASLSQVIAAKFFSGLNPTAAFIFSLLAFSAGFVVRPFGALVFSRLGDLVGRKHTFLVTILFMGASTFVAGLIPVYETIGITAPTLLITLRLVQGLAVGGEYGGAVVYVAEHALDWRRGLYTGFIQATPGSWGWRIPFLLSCILLVISVWIGSGWKNPPRS